MPPCHSFSTENDVAMLKVTEQRRNAIGRLYTLANQRHVVRHNRGLHSRY